MCNRSWKQQFTTVYKITTKINKYILSGSKESNHTYYHEAFCKIKNNKWSTFISKQSTVIGFVQWSRSHYIQKIKENVTDDLFQHKLTEGGYYAASQEVMHLSRISMFEESIKAPWLWAEINLLKKNGEGVGGGGDVPVSSLKKNQTETHN